MSKSTSQLTKDLQTAPNLISLAQIAFVVGSIIALVFGQLMLGIILGASAGIADYLDGYVARRTGQVTHLGEVLDRMGDLMFEAMGFVYAVAFGVLSPLFLLAYLFREFAITSIRHYCVARGHEISSSIFGKLKTNFFGYSFLLIYIAQGEYFPAISDYMRLLAITAISVGLLFSYISGYQYASAFADLYNKDHGDKE